MPGPDKYHSIHTLQQADKIEALKDTKLNPNLIEDGYDQVSHALHLWSVTGTKAKAAPNISFDEQKTIASNFYDRVIGPAYGHLGNTFMSKDTFMKQAYDEALQYKIEDAYTNNWTDSLKHGWNSGLAATARAADRVVTALGDTYDDAVAQFHKELLAAQYGGDQYKVKEWTQRVQEVDTQLAVDKKYRDNALQRGARYQSDHRQFWADALPGHDGFLNKATSFVAEQAGQLPVYAALDLGGAVIGAGGKAVGLTDRLAASPIGKRVSGYLLAGAEGLAYGAATHKQDDPGEAWRDALGYTVFHGLFDIGGVGLKKLIDLVPKDSDILPKLKARQDALELAQAGKRPATPVEVYDMHKTEVANNLFVGGVAMQRSIFVDALHFVHQTEGMDKDTLKAHTADLLGIDPDRWAPVLSSAKFVRSLLGNKKISEIQPGSEDEKYLSSRLAQLITDAGSEMNTRVHGMAEQAEQKTPENLKKPSAKNTLEYYVNQAKNDLAKNPGAAAIVTPEQIQKSAEKKYAADLQKAAEEAEKETGTSKTEKAQNIANRRKTSPGDVDLRTRRGDGSVSVQVVPYKVRLQQHTKAAQANGQTLTQYFKDLDDKDFEADLTQYFYPKALKDAKVFFEHQNTREGAQNPNFLAFMHNYYSQMPREFSDALISRLMDTAKSQKFMNGRNATEPQLAYYAKAMYNHVDNLLGSGRWPAEQNIFRTSNESIFKTTKWQRQLLVEKTLQEQKNLKDMFSGDAKGLRLALQTHAALAKMRMKEFDTASLKNRSQDKIKAFNDEIANLQTSTGTYERWDF